MNLGGYMTGGPSAFMFSSGKSSSKKFTVSRGGLSCGVGSCCCDTCKCTGAGGVGVGVGGSVGIIKRNPTEAGCYYPNWWKSDTCMCSGACEVGTCSQNLINTCPNLNGDTTIEDPIDASVVKIVQRALDDVDDVDDETAAKLIAMMKGANRQ